MFDKYLPPVVVRAIDNISRIKWSSYPIKIPELQAAVYLLLKKRTMGYYTHFTNHDTKLDRNLTEDEMSKFNLINENFHSWWEIETKEISWIDEAFLCIWDEDEMKAYDWKSELKLILNLFTSFWIMANGSITWDWEESWDVWTCAIVDNEATLSNFASVQNIVALLVDAGLNEAAKLVEYHYCEKL